MEELKITRYDLFTFAQKKAFDDGLFDISEMYRIAAAIIKGMEDELIEKQKETVDFFYQKLQKNINQIENPVYFNNKDYSVEINKSFENKIKGKVNTSYINCFYYLLEVISDSQNKKMEKSFFKNQDSFRNKYQYDGYTTKVFLSYAYLDRGISLALFYYFLNEGIFLYIDWMHNDVIMDCATLKNDLRYHLETSHQLLLLRTINSELSIQGGNKTIRQWCAWELGCFYGVEDKKKNEKYYIDFYGNDFVKTTRSPNLFMDTIKKMQGILGHEIV